MPKPDPALLDPARYPFSCAIETRFSDIDVNQHINNVSLVSMLQEARVRFHRAAGYTPGASEDEGGGPSSMVASITVEYLGQSHFPAPLEMHVAPARLGNTSYTLNQLVTQDGRIVAYAQAVMVCVDAQGPASLPEAFRSNSERWMMRA
ncbi:thioesterase family protein [Novosphingobium sp. PS1R-30]|uniref:Thioesterase family protein n=1 Tax=Novosphingobium anseongense TaxID=3133436 RepID=A0ABU8RVU4_9SPHN